MIVQTEPLYRCDICGYVAKWDKEWSINVGYRIASFRLGKRK